MTEQTLIKRINRRLPEHHRLHKSRPHEQPDLGTYYVVDHYHNVVVDHHFDDLEMLELGLAVGEAIGDAMVAGK